jgi:NifU-like protein involved in Fe-S cluster formation
MQSNLSRQERPGFILQHADNSKYQGVLPEADIVFGGGGGERAESIKVYLQLDGAQRIAQAAFEADGTTLGRAAASFTIENIIGKTLTEVLDLSPELILDTFGRDIAGERVRSATVTLDTIKVATRKYLNRNL